MADRDFDAISLEERIEDGRRKGRGLATPKPEPNIGLVKITALLACVGVVILVVMLPVYYKVIAPDSGDDTAPITESPVTTTKEIEPTEPPVITTTEPPVITTTEPPVITTTEAPETEPVATTIAPETEPVATTIAPTLTPVPEIERFNCAPDNGATQEDCISRGCAYDDASSEGPACYYTGADPSYEVDGTEVEVGKKLSLTLKVPTAVTRDTGSQWYGTPFPKLKVEATKMTKERLRIKIFPPGEDRFEVPIELDQDEIGPDETLTETDYLYTVEFVTSEPNFGVRVKRKSSDTVIFDTTVGKMIFADQFLQISTSLPSEYVYGFGEQQHESFKHDLNWKKLGMFARDQGVGADANLYGVHPFHMTMEGDGNAHAILFLNSNAQEVELQPKPALTYRSIGGIMEFDIFLGPKPESVIDQYTQMIGRPYFPPLWSLGFQLCRYGYENLDNLTRVVNRMLDSDIPYDVQYSDIDYMERQLDFTVDNVAYGGLTEFVQDLKTNHSMKYIIILDPAISSSEIESYPPYEQGVDNDVFIKNSDGSDFAYGKVWPYWPNVTTVDNSLGWDELVATYNAFVVFPDYAKAETQAWWTAFTVAFHDQIQFDGLWIDMNEPANFVHGSPTGCTSTKYDDDLPFHPGILGEKLYDKTICMSSQQYNPKTLKSDEKHYNMHNLFGRLQIKPTLDACREATGERCIVITRSTYPGSGRHGGHWLGDNTSDWPFLRASIIGMLEFNLFGIPYVGADICGFFNDAERQLCLRWSQLGAFYPFSRNHNSIGNADQDPASFDAEFTQIVADILKVRYRILPYFYTLFHHANERGATVARSLLAEFPDDTATYDISEQFLLGGHILLTPVVYVDTFTVNGYFPDARWFDYFTGEEIDARKTSKTLDAPLDVLPIHIRGGAIIPTQKPEKTITEQHGNNFGIIYALPDEGVEAEGELYWDDGNSINPDILELELRGTETSLSSTLVKNDYIVTSVFETVEVLGVNLTDVNDVVVDGISHANFAFNSTISKLEINGLNLDMNSAWSITWNYVESPVSRQNCLPGKGEVTEELCTSKGCLWDDRDTHNCYYPQDFQNYLRNGDITTTDRGQEFSMDHLNGNSFFSTPISKVHVLMEYISENQLRVKISDEDNLRYEVPLDMGRNDGVSAGNDPLYNAEYSGTSPGLVVITRRSTDEEVARVNMGTMIFEEQFLQISIDFTTSSVYGLGEFERTSYKHDFNGKIFGMFTRDEGVKQDANLYGQHPFLMRVEKSGKASGIFLKNSNAMEVELAPESTVIWRTTGGILDFHIFMGPTPEDVIQQYTNAVGRPMMPPYWALGFQLSKYGYGNLTQMQTVVEENRNYGVPHDVQYGDVDTMKRRLDFTVDPDNFGGLPDFVDQIRDEYNMRYVIILDPAISMNETDAYPPCTDGEAADVFIRQENGEILYGNVWPYVPGFDGIKKANVAFPDFMKSETSDWWGNQIDNFYNELKFDGIWIDMNEPANFVDGSVDGCPVSNYENPPFLPNIGGDSLNNKTICMTAKQSVSGTEELHYNVHSLYGWSQAQPTLEACRATTGKRCFVISRSTYPGAGKFTGHWFGDNTSKWSHLHASIISMFDFSLFGFGYTGADICGFFLDASESLCRRWSQLGAFYPFSRNHAMLETRRQDPASFGESFAHEVRDVLLIRYRLLPYLYTLFYHAHTTGSSVVRPLLNVFPDDAATQDIDRQFMWGSALLISPVLEAEKTDVEVYFPDNRWFNYYDGKEVTTRKDVTTLSAPEDYINLHISGGNIIITQEPAITTFQSRQNAFELLVALDDDMKSYGSMYWDNGDVIDVETDSILMKLTCEMNMLENHIVRDSYSDSDLMELRRVVVMGLRDTVTAVYVNNDVIYMFEQDARTKMLTIELPRTQLNQEFKITWDFTNEKSRIDCWPDLTEDTAGALTEEKCIQRNCLYTKATIEGAPSCYFDNSQDNHKYQITNQGAPGTAETYELIPHASNEIYGPEIEHVQLEQTWETENRFHFKFKDANNERWEVPDSLVDLSHSKSDQLDDKNAALYRVQTNADPFFLKIYHKDDMNTPLIDTSIGPLKFGDQFLQISTALPSTNIYGFGGHNHKRLRHDLNWRRWAIFTRDVAPIDAWNLYSHHPFFMATTEDGSVSFGLFLHNTNAMDIVLQPHPAMTYRVTGGVLDFYFFISDTPEGLIQQYHQLIGPPVMPPYWSLGFHLSKWNYGNLTTVREIYEEMRTAEIPYDVQFGDIDYMQDKKDFTYDQAAYAGLPEFINELHDNGMRYIVIIDPGIKIEEGYKAYDEGLDQNVFIVKPDGVTPLETEVWPGETHHPDFTHPNVTSWWTDQCEHLYHDWNITFDALWIDMNELTNFQPDDPDKLAAMNCTGKYNIPAYMPNILWYGVGLHDKAICMDNLHYGGLLHYNAHSLYGHTMSTTTHQTLTDMMPNKRSLVLTRSSYAGTGRYAATWTGDNQSFWHQLQDSITAIIEHNMFGFAMVGADICGFWDKPSMELCLRWTQVGAFYPFSRNHNADGWPHQHPTAFKNETMTEVSRNVLLTRYRLLPFMYTQFYQTNKNGGTFWRSLAHEFPADVETRNINYQFMIGSSFLVTPVLHEGTTDVIGYFPALERWFDYYTGKEVEESGKFVKLDSPLEYINLHVRGGHILPMQQPNVTTTLSREKPMKLMIALDANHQATGSLYWDDGEARNVGENFALLQFSCSKQPDNSYQLTTRVEHPPAVLDGFSNLIFDEIFVMGLDQEQISSVHVNGVEFGVYDYSNGGFLRLFEMDIPVHSNNDLSWT